MWSVEVMTGIFASFVKLIFPAANLRCLNWLSFPPAYRCLNWLSFPRLTSMYLDTHCLGTNCIDNTSWYNTPNMETSCLMSGDMVPARHCTLSNTSRELPTVVPRGSFIRDSTTLACTPSSLATLICQNRPVYLILFTSSNIRWVVSQFN